MDLDRPVVRRETIFESLRNDVRRASNIGLYLGLRAVVAAHESRFCPSIVFRGAFVKKIIQGLHSIMMVLLPEKLSKIGAIPCLAIMLLGDNALIMLAGFGISSLITGVLCHSLLVKNNKLNTNTHMMAKLLIVVGVVASPLVFLAKMSPWRLLFGMAEGLLCSCSAVGIGQWDAPMRFGWMRSRLWEAANRTANE